MGKLQRVKGQVWEREVAGLLRDALGMEGIRRGLQSRGGGKEVPDIEGVPLFHPECKHGKAVSWQAAMRQAREDAAEGLHPVAVIKDHGNAHPSPFVVMEARGWAALTQAYRERTGSPRSPLFDEVGSLAACKPAQLRACLAGEIIKRRAAPACVTLADGTLYLAMTLAVWLRVMALAVGRAEG